jgi:hypothetical protein
MFDNANALFSIAHANSSFPDKVFLTSPQSFLRFHSTNMIDALLHLLLPATLLIMDAEKRVTHVYSIHKFMMKYITTTCWYSTRAVVIWISDADCNSSGGHEQRALLKTTPMSNGTSDCGLEIRPNKIIIKLNMKLIDSYGDSSIETSQIIKTNEGCQNVINLSWQILLAFVDVRFVSFILRVLSVMLIAERLRVRLSLSIVISWIIPLKHCRSFPQKSKEVDMLRQIAKNWKLLRRGYLPS